MLQQHHAAWTENRTARAVELWLAGRTASEIARELGSTTRNAVIGRLHRMGLSGRDNPTRKSVRSTRQFRGSRGGPRNKRQVSEREAIERQRRKALAAISIERCDNQSGPDLLRPVHEMVKTVDLEPHHCKWVYGDEPYLHCGLHRTCIRALDENNMPTGPVTQFLSPYCEFHAQRAYKPIQPAYSGNYISRVGNPFFRPNGIPLGTQSASLKEFDTEPA